MGTGIVVLGHGSNSAADEGNQMVLALAEMVKQLIADCHLETAFLNPRSQRQRLGEAVEKLVASGARRIIVAPVFLSRGQHIQKDIPEEIEILRRKHRVEIVLADCLGPDRRIAEIMVERIREVASGVFSDGSAGY